MSVNNAFNLNHELPRFTWEPGVLKAARKRRMRLAWSVWFVAALFVLFQFFLQLSSGEFINGLMKSFALTAFGGGVLASSYYYIYVLLQTPAGMLLDRYGPRGILSAGALIVCIGCLLFSAAKTLFFALLGRVLMGGGAAFAFVGCLNIISIWFPVRRFAFMAAIVETAGMFGAIIGNFWLANYIEKLGWRDCLFFAGIFAGFLSFFLISVVRNSPRKKIIHRAFVRTSLRAGLKKIMHNPIVWINGVYSGLMFGIVTVFIALWAIPFFEFVHHMNLVQATLTASALYVGVAIGGPIIGWLDGKTNLRKRIMIANAFGASVCLFFVVFATQLPTWSIATLLFFTGMCASSYVLTFAIANEIATVDNRATCIGFTNMLCVIFAPILQPFVGFLITHLKGMPHYYEWSMSIVPILLLLVATPIGFFLPERR
jgi:MFS family permease